LTEWLDSQGFLRGATASPQTLLDLGADWYGTRLDYDRQPASAAEATATFARHGLIGDFWTLM
jgi:hypothetical protein